MKNIKTLEEYIKEAFKADIDNDNESESTLDIELPDEKGRKMFKLKNGEPYEVTKDNPQGEKIDDKETRKFVIQAIRGIKNIKEQDRANCIERISGGDSNIIKKIEDLYDTNDETHIIRLNTKVSKEDEKPDMYSLWEEIKDLKPYESKYISLKSLSQSQKAWFTIDGMAIGKGEYFLPIIYTDVYKSKSHGYEDDDETFTKGDNRLCLPNGEFCELELKSAGDGRKFESYRSVPEKYNPNENKKEFKDAVVGSLAKYMIQRNYKDRQTYCIIFDNSISTSYKEKSGSDIDGFFIFYVGETINPTGTSDRSLLKNQLYQNVFNALYDKVEISDSFYHASSKNTDFTYEYSGGERGNIVVYLYKQYSDNYKKRF